MPIDMGQLGTQLGLGWELDHATVLLSTHLSRNPSPRWVYLETHLSHELQCFARYGKFLSHSLQYLVSMAGIKGPVSTQHHTVTMLMGHLSLAQGLSLCWMLSPHAIIPCVPCVPCVPPVNPACPISHVSLLMGSSAEGMYL